MDNFENLSPAAQRGLENFRKSISRLMEDSYLRNNKLFSIFSYVEGFCLAAGASPKEAMQAANFARSKDYWVDPKYVSLIGRFSEEKGVVSKCHFVIS